MASCRLLHPFLPMNEVCGKGDYCLDDKICSMRVLYQIILKFLNIVKKEIVIELKWW